MLSSFVVARYSINSIALGMSNTIAMFELLTVTDWNEIGIDVVMILVFSGRQLHARVVI